MTEDKANLTLPSLSLLPGETLIQTHQTLVKHTKPHPLFKHPREYTSSANLPTYCTPTHTIKIFSFFSSFFTHNLNVLTSITSTGLFQKQ